MSNNLLLPYDEVLYIHLDAFFALLLKSVQKKGLNHIKPMFAVHSMYNLFI